MAEKISILMPVYNAAPYLEECLESILSQTFPDWVLWAVDDFSTDNSASILEAFAKKDSRIRPLPNTDKGIIPALRTAFAKSTGQLLTRMDADDKMPVQKLALMQAAMRKAGRGHLATGRVQYFSQKGIQDGYRRYEQWLNHLVHEDRHYEEIYRECVIPSPAWMVYREDLLRCEAFKPNRYPEDYDLVFRFYQYGLKVIPIPELLHYWRDHRDRSSRTMAQYANQSYFKLKIPWFLTLDREAGRPLVLWGAGNKGKQVAKMLLQTEEDFRWVCDNQAKIGLDIYGLRMQHYQAITQMDDPQVLVLVSNPEDQVLIREQLEAWRVDYFFMV
ncbi:MAG TPA: glycosyltransferase family 2 protein [Saprospiraceae bacterium]|nr:glycosyltransferase family 2 protein [Saprospiraceae bacterium]